MERGKQWNASMFCILLFIVPLFTLRFGSDFYDLPKLFILSLLLFAVLIPHLITKTSSDFPMIFLYPLFLFLLSVFLSWYFSVSPVLSFMGVYTGKEGVVILCLFVIFYFLFAHSVSAVNLPAIFVSSLIALTLVSILSFVQYYGFHLPVFIEPQFEKLSRPRSTIGPSTQLGGYLAACLPFFIILFAGARSRLKMCFLACGFFISSIAVLLTMSRGGILAFFLSIIFMFAAFLTKYSSARKYVKHFLFFFVCAIIFIRIFPFKIDPYHKVEHTLTDRFRVTSMTGTTVRVRLIIWEGAVRLIRDYPLFGAGVDAVPAVFQNYQKPFLIKAVGSYMSTAKIHNQFLQVAATQGLFGLFAWLWIIGVFYGKAFALYRSSAAGSEKSFFLLACMGSFTAFLIQSCFTLNTVSSNMLFWFNLAAIEVLNNDGHISHPSVRMPAVKIHAERIVFLLPLLIVMVCFAGDIYFRKGMNNLHRNNLQASEYYMSKALSLNPYEGIYRFSAGSLYTRMNRWDDALHAYDDASSVFPYDPRILTIRAVVYEGIGKKEKAYEFYRKALVLCEKMGCRDAETDFFDILSRKIKPQNQAKPPR